MTKLFQILTLVFALLILKGTEIVTASNYSAYQSFLTRYSKVTNLNAPTARKTYTDQQLAKIGVIKDFSALTQARLYLTADKQLEALDSYKRIILQRQTEGFDQTKTLQKIDEVEKKYILVITRIDQIEKMYENLEYTEYGSIRPTYNNILKESVEIATSLEQLNTEIYELIIENL